ncbi:hypothetical protein D9M70_550790 [compost metagenome]
MPQPGTLQVVITEGAYRLLKLGNAPTVDQLCARRHRTVLDQLPAVYQRLLQAFASGTVEFRRIELQAGPHTNAAEHGPQRVFPCARSGVGHCMVEHAEEVQRGGQRLLVPGHRPTAIICRQLGRLPGFTGEEDGQRLEAELLLHDTRALLQIGLVLEEGAQQDEPAVGVHRNGGHAFG